jgi:ABC-type proline/glycine betaine transport system substrate-binding protein
MIYQFIVFSLGYIDCFPTKYTALRSKRWLAQNEDIVSEWSDMYSTKCVGLVQRWLAQNQDIVSEWSDMNPISMLV